MGCPLGRWRGLEGVHLRCPLWWCRVGAPGGWRKTCCGRISPKSRGRLRWRSGRKRHKLFISVELELQGLMFWRLQMQLGKSDVLLLNATPRILFFQIVGPAWLRYQSLASSLDLVYGKYAIHLFNGILPREPPFQFRRTSSAPSIRMLKARARGEPAITYRWTA